MEHRVTVRTYRSKVINRVDRVFTGIRRERLYVVHVNHKAYTHRRDPE